MNTKRAKTNPPRKATPPLFKAKAKNLAKYGIVGATSNVANDMMSRIRKCIQRAEHPNTPEAEAKRALHLASQLMGRYNVSRAEVLAQEPPDSHSKYRGQSNVFITRVDGNKKLPIVINGFVDEVCCAMEDFFTCKYFTVKHRNSGVCTKLEVTFYGIAENTVAAALAFEMTYNLILEWARPYKGMGGKNSYTLGIAHQLTVMAEEAKATEEKDAKKRERHDAIALAARIAQEKAERRAQLSRLAPLPQDRAVEDLQKSSYLSNGRGYSSNNARLSTGQIENNKQLRSYSKNQDKIPDSSLEPDEDGFQHDDDDFEADFEVEHQHDEIRQGLDRDVDDLLNRNKPAASQSSHLQGEKPYVATSVHEPHKIKKGLSALPGSSVGQQGLHRPATSEVVVASKWASHMQLMTFRENAMKIADDYAKDEGWKIKTGRKRSYVIKDRDAYDEGVKDGKKIDVYRRSIEGSK